MGKQTILSILKDYLLEVTNKTLYKFNLRLITSQEWGFIRQSKEDFVVPWADIYNQEAEIDNQHLGV